MSLSPPRTGSTPRDMRHADAPPACGAGRPAHGGPGRAGFDKGLSSPALGGLRGHRPVGRPAPRLHAILGAHACSGANVKDTNRGSPLGRPARPLHSGPSYPETITELVDRFWVTGRGGGAGVRGFWACGAGAASRAARPTLVRGGGGRRRRHRGPAATPRWKSALLTKSGLADREPTPRRHVHMHRGAWNVPCRVRPPSSLPLFVLRLYGRSRGPDMPWGGRGRGGGCPVRSRFRHGDRTTWLRTIVI